MGSNKQSIIIEFNGMPGSGKTTVASLLAKKLRANGNDVVDFSYFFWTSDETRLKKIFKTIRWGSVKCLWRLLWFLWSVRPFKKFRLKYAHYCFSYFSAYRKFMTDKKEASCMIIDQGIIQIIISIMYLDFFRDLVPLKKLLECIVENTNNYINVNCISDEKTAAERIISRKKLQGRFDKMSENEIIRNLEIQKVNFQTVRDCMSEIKSIERFDIEMKNNAQQNCQLLYDKILKVMMGGSVDEK